MKGIVMTAQDAREFEKLGGLTITKPIRPEPITYCEGLHLVEKKPGNWLLVGGDNDIDRAEKFSNWYKAPVKAGLLDSSYREPFCNRGKYVRGDPGGGAVKRSCENCGNIRCANSPIAFNWDECVKSGFEKNWRPKGPNAGEKKGEKP